VVADNKVDNTRAIANFPRTPPKIAISGRRGCNFAM